MLMPTLMNAGERLHLGSVLGLTKLPSLAEAGVGCLKMKGEKKPEYVAVYPELRTNSTTLQQVRSSPSARERSGAGSDIRAIHAGMYNGRCRDTHAVHRQPRSESARSWLRRAISHPGVDQLLVRGDVWLRGA